MQVRVFEAADMASGLKMVRQELGADALILSTRTVRNGKLGILGKPIFEITAAIDTPWPKENGQSRTSSSSAQAISQNARQNTQQKVGLHHVVGNDDDNLLSFEPPPAAPLSSSGGRNAKQNFLAEEASRDNALRQEFDELKNLVKNLATDIARINTSTPAGSTQFQTRDEAPATLPKRLQPSDSPADSLVGYLLDRGIHLETARTMADFARESLSDQDLHDPETLRSYFFRTIRDNVVVQPPDFAAATERQQRLALIGPTGVGKTTTLAKIAAHYLSRFSPSIALITIDTYRIAAVEQLKVYGEIMHLPVEVVISPEQLDQALQRHQDKELILIDTAGRSPRDSLCIEELATFLRPELGIDKHLVLSATTRDVELADMVRRFDILGIDRIIFTKIDECSQLGSLLNVQIQYGQPLSYVTNGQRVPEDLIEITQETIAELIMSPQEGIVHD
jgi:flagellar biosynthesis protein FlhF